MSQPIKPAFQKSSKSSTTSSASPSTAPAAVGGRWSTGYSPVRGLSPVRSTFHGVARQDMDSARSHTNPLFTSRSSDTAGRNMSPATTPSKSSKEAKENRERQDPWKVPMEKSQYGTKTLSSTPTATATPVTGKATPGKPTPVKTPARTPTSSAMPMRFATPPKPVARRKILAENRDLTLTPSRIGRDEDGKKPGGVAPTTLGRKEAPIGPSSAVEVNAPASKTQNDGDGLYRGEDAELPSSRGSAPAAAGPVDPKPKSSLASIEELQKRIQKFLQEEEIAAVDTTTVPAADGRGQLSPIQGAGGSNPQQTYSGSGAGDGIPASAAEEAPYNPDFAPYLSRREFLRVSKSPTSGALDGAVSPPRDVDEGMEDPERALGPPTYDPRNNFLSPRPQFLRYKPLRRLEVLRKSAEGTLGLADLDLDSPAATDGGSSRVESSEKDDGESPDGCQEEVQSLKTSPESRSDQKSLRPGGPVPPEEVEVQGESIGHSGLESGTTTERILDSTPSVSRTPPATGVDAKSLVDAAREVAGWERKDVKQDEGVVEVEVDDEDEDEDESECSEDRVKSTGSRVLQCARRILVTLAVSALLLSASGSTGLLPLSLHQNRLAHLWKTSTVVEPVRQLLRSTQGLWIEHPLRRKGGASRPFPKFSVDELKAGCGGIKNLLFSVELDGVQNAGRVLLSSSRRHVAGLKRYVMTRYRNFKAWFGDYAEYLENSRTQDVDEWGWVADYDFVVPHDMVDSSHVHEVFLSPLMQALSGWFSVLGDPGYVAGRRIYLTKPVGVNGDSAGRKNFSVCPVQLRLEGRNMLPSARPVAVGTVSVHPSVFSRPNFELSSAVDQRQRDLPSLEDDSFGPESFTAAFRVDQQPGAGGALITVTEKASEAEIRSGVGTGPSLPVSREMLVSNIIAQDGQEAGVVMEIHVAHVVEHAEPLASAEHHTQALHYAPALNENELIPASASEDSLLSRPIGISSDMSEETGRLSSPLSDSSQQSMPSEVQSSEVSSLYDITRSKFNELEKYPPHGRREAITPIEQETARFLALEERPKASKLSKIIHTPLLQNLWKTRSISQTAAVVAVVASLVLLVAGWVALNRAKKVGGSSKAKDGGKKTSLPSEADLIGARPDGFSIFSSAERSPELFQSTFLKPFDSYSTDRYLTNDYLASPALAGGRDYASLFAPENYVEPLYHTVPPDPNPTATDFSANTDSTTTPEKFYSRRGRDTVAAERSSSPPPPALEEIPPSSPLQRSASNEHEADDSTDLLRSPEVSAVVEDSSLGRFTALVPVVLNEGTVKEQVKLTPVRRSSRIRTRLQSPCKPGGHHHLCSCENEAT